MMKVDDVGNRDRKVNKTEPAVRRQFLSGLSVPRSEGMEIEVPAESQSTVDDCDCEFFSDRRPQPDGHHPNDES